MTTKTQEEQLSTTIYGLTPDHLHSAVDIVREISHSNKDTANHKSSRRDSLQKKKKSKSYWIISSALFSMRGKASYICELMIGLKEKYEDKQLTLTEYEYELGLLKKEGDSYASSFHYLHDIMTNLLVTEGFAKEDSIPFTSFDINEVDITRELKEIGELGVLKERVKNDKALNEQIDALMETLDKYGEMSEQACFATVCKLLDKVDNDINHNTKNKRQNAKSRRTSYRTHGNLDDIDKLEQAFKQLNKLVEYDSFGIVEEGGCH